jgi:DNA-binding FadR family transcriptional regulator
MSTRDSEAAGTDRDETPSGEASVSHASVRKQPKRAEALAWAIERDILAGGWEVGGHFGDEAQLIERYGVSRAVLREAIQLVERHELAASRRGRAGGLIETAPAEQSVARAISLYLELVGVSVPQLVATRTVLELLAVRGAVERLDEAGITRLREVVDSEEGAGICAAPQALHRTIVELSGNAVTRVYLDALIPILRRQPAVSAFVRSDAATPVPRLPGVHRQIAEAIVRGDVAASEQKMAEHLGAVLALSAPDVAPAPTAPAPTAPAPTAPAPVQVPAPEAIPVEEAEPRPLGRPRARRASDQVLQAILEQIQVAGGRPGTYLGAEGELLAKYGASRAALREAVRLLEHVGIAEMRRGTSGGLFVTEPAPDGIGTTIAMYLEHGGASLDDLRDVRMELELQSVRSIAAGATDEVRSRLEAILRRERRAGARLIEPKAEGPYRLSMATQFHFFLADACDNRATQVLSRPVIALTSGGHVHTPLAEEERELRASQVRAAHRGIIEALVAGDQDIAAHRMRQHLAAVSQVTADQAT